MENNQEQKPTENNIGQTEGSYNSSSQNNNQTTGNYNLPPLPKKNNMTKYLIIGGVVILGIILVVSLIPNKDDESSGIFSIFDQFFDRFDESAEKMQEDYEDRVEDMNEDQDEREEEFENAQKEADVLQFNILIDEQGLISGTRTINLLNQVISSIDTKPITVIFNETEMTTSPEILGVITTIDTFSNYTVLNTKDQDGYINSITINLVE